VGIVGHMSADGFFDIISNNLLPPVAPRDLGVGHGERKRGEVEGYLSSVFEA
jgi:hypothetical protein